MLVRRVSVTNLNASHDVGPTGSNQAQIFAKDGKLYAQLQGYGEVELADLVGQNAGSPVGTVISFGGASLPAGWLECNGDEVAAQYSDLNTVLNGLYGTGSNGRSLLPDLRGRMPLGAGAGSNLTARSQGNTGGVEGVTLTTSELPAHNHTATDSGHSHGVNDSGHSHAASDSGHSHSIDQHRHEVDSHDHQYDSYSFNTGYRYEGDSSNSSFSYVRSYYSSSDYTGNSSPYTDYQSLTANSSSASITVSSATSGLSVNSGSSNISVGNTGSGGEHDNMSPWLALKFLIKT